MQSILNPLTGRHAVVRSSNSRPYSERLTLKGLTHNTRWAPCRPKQSAKQQTLAERRNMWHSPSLSPRSHDDVPAILPRAVESFSHHQSTTLHPPCESQPHLLTPSNITKSRKCFLMLRYKELSSHIRPTTPTLYKTHFAYTRRSTHLSRAAE